MAAEERSISEVVQDIAGNVQEIVRSEARLAAAELKQEAATAAKAAVTLALGAVLGLYALAFLLLALLYGLAAILGTWWAAALIVGAGLAVLALILLAAGRARMRSASPVPERTLRSTKETLAWDKRRST